MVHVPDPTTCHKCRERPGERVPYYYGRRTSPWWSLRPTYDILGEAEVVLCEVCRPAKRRLQRAYARAVLWTAVWPAVMVGHTGFGEWRNLHRPGYVASSPWEWWAAPLLGGMAVALAIYIIVDAGRKWRASRLDPIRESVRLEGASGLPEERADTVLLPDEYDRLLAQGRIRRVAQEIV